VSKKWNAKKVEEAIVACVAADEYGPDIELFVQESDALMDAVRKTAKELDVPVALCAKLISTGMMIGLAAGYEIRKREEVN